MKILCINCFREFSVDQEIKKVWSHIQKKYIEIPNDLCDNCIFDVGILDKNEVSPDGDYNEKEILGL